MPFEQYAEFNPSDLSLETIYRFAEIEINQAIKLFTKAFSSYPDGYNRAQDFIMKQLFEREERTTERLARWEEATRYHYFRIPQKQELILYFLYKQQSYGQIRKLTGASPNTIAKYRFQPAPFYMPVYDGWNNEMLQRWNDLKLHLNLWQQDLAHTEN